MLIEFERCKDTNGKEAVAVRLVVEGPPQQVVAERIVPPFDPLAIESIQICGADLFLCLPPGSYQR